MGEIIISFVSPTYALRAYDILPEGVIIPTPISITGSCGMSIQITGDREEILSRLKKANISWAVIT